MGKYTHYHMIQIILDYIYNNCFEPFSISMNEINEVLAVDTFDELLILMVSEWERVHLDRNEISELMQRHYDYLNYLLTTKQSHIHRVLVGSINYFFSFLTTMLYSFSDECIFNKVMSEAREIFIDFLKKTRIMYPTACQHMDNCDLEVTSHFRRI